MYVAWGGQRGYHLVALNLSLAHKTTENPETSQSLHIEQIEKAGATQSCIAATY